MISMFKDDYIVHILDQRLQSIFADEGAYLQFVLDFIPALASNERLSYLFLHSNSLGNIIHTAMGLNKGHGGSKLKVEDKLTGIMALIEIWERWPSVINQGGYQDEVINCLKSCIKDYRSSVLESTAITFLFHLLNNFAIHKNATATVIYKTLTFLLIEKFESIETRTNFLCNFLTTL